MSYLKETFSLLRLHALKIVGVRDITLKHIPLLLVVIAPAVLIGGSAAAMAANMTLRAAVLEKITTVSGNGAPTPPVKASTVVSAPTIKPVPATSTPISPQPVTKYVAPPDPRPTTYSTTPPAPPPSDINIRITQPNQVPVGTKIAYSALKEYTVYYGGDMVFSPSPIVIHKYASLFSAPITVSTPDGQAMTAPARPWYDASPTAWVSTTAAPDATMTSWPITFQLTSSLPTGTYQAHITAWRSGGTGALEWQYDGFATIVVQND